jgi:hypothetical protein
MKPFSVDFPPELWEEVITHLPLVPLIKSMGVCKSWRRTIQNPASPLTVARRSLLNLYLSLIDSPAFITSRAENVDGLSSLDRMAYLNGLLDSYNNPSVGENEWDMPSWAMTASQYHRPSHISLYDLTEDFITYILEWPERAIFCRLWPSTAFTGPFSLDYKPRNARGVTLVTTLQSIRVDFLIPAERRHVDVDYPIMPALLIHDDLRTGTNAIHVMFLGDASTNEVGLPSNSGNLAIREIKHGDVVDMDTNRHLGGQFWLALSQDSLRLGNGWINYLRLQADRMEEELKWAAENSDAEIISKWHYRQVQSAREHADGEKTFYQKWLAKYNINA